MSPDMYESVIGIEVLKTKMNDLIQNSISLWCSPGLRVLGSQVMQIKG